MTCLSVSCCHLSGEWRLSHFMTKSVSMGKHLQGEAFFHRGRQSLTSSQYVICSLFLFSFILTFVYYFACSV